MKAAIPGLVAYTALTFAATAADLPRRAVPPVFTPVPVFTWTGFYAGFNAGYAWSDDRVATRAFDPTNAFAVAAIAGLNVGRRTYDQAGFTGGAQIGYNHQLTPGSGVVVGLEADAQYTDLKRRLGGGFSRDVSADVGLPPGTATDAYIFAATKRLDFLGTVRGRLGYAWDRVLVYGTGGFAYGQSEYRFSSPNTFTVSGPGGFVDQLIVTGGDRRLQTGYVYGGGIEYALPTDNVLNVFKASAVTFKVEYLHYDLGTRNVIGFVNTVPAGPTPGPATTLSRVRTEGDIVRVGVNYKFGSY